MPISDIDDASARGEQVILDALELDTLSFEKLSSPDIARIKRQIATLEGFARSGNVEELGAMIDAIGVVLKNASLEAQVLFAERVDRAAGADDRLFPQAGFALTAAGYQLWCASRNAEALGYYQRAVQRLEDCTHQRAYAVWGDAMVACAVLGGDRALDENKALIERLVERSLSIEHRDLRFWALFGVRRCAEQLTRAARWNDAIALAKRGLEIPFAHLKPIPSWYEARVFMHSRAMVAHRELGQHEAVIAMARASEPDCERVTSDAGLLEVCWILTEAAFVAADRLGDSALAQTFIRMIRDRADHPKAALLAPELAYAITMEAKAHQLQGRSDMALRSCDEAIGWAQRASKPANAYNAFAEALCLRAAVYDQRGERDKALAAWREVIERFGELELESLRPQVAEARAGLKQAS
jgi:tetratricopeptide (TPR) repeat protein